MEGDCVLWGSRVVIPRAGRQMLLEELHAGHPGVTRMKRLARTVIWWPGLDSDIENKVQSCKECQIKSEVTSNGSTPPMGVAYRSMDFPSYLSLTMRQDLPAQIFKS